MSALIPHRFLLRVAQPCPYVKAMPHDMEVAEQLIDLPENARLRNFAELDGKANFADVRLAWNHFGLGVQLTVTGKQQLPTGEAGQPRAADGLTLWIDTRDARTSHRASRYCHQFHFVVAAVAEGVEPFFAQSKINRALQDAPSASAEDVLLHFQTRRDGYRLEAFLPAAALTGFDPDQHARLGVYYAVRDQELGDQFLGVGWDFPVVEDPSLWDALDLLPPEA